MSVHSDERVTALSTARHAAVAELCALNDRGLRLRWRLVSLDYQAGVALVCESPDHGRIREGTPDEAPDHEGVYDCCPWPYLEVGPPALAVYLVALLNTDAGGVA
ncbi:hypothetical protein [Streptomyces iconiensis]|uniref:Uncharacterized protein n=1 Tax=Streptomyces iconiensis TaxID=1384038 RepID=A0ABT7AD56_9ACTN|nr:hypothetical protein [Streptomyces iconiensis]MDJ1138538.1 hypothetical protein [Streptomyces iconiensis]